MKKTTTYALFIIFSAIIQTSFLRELFGTAANTNLVAAFVLALVIIDDYEGAYWASLLGGIFLDIILGSSIGLSSLMLCIFVWLYSQLKSFYLRNFFSSLIFSTFYFYTLKLVVSHVVVFDGWIIFGALLTAILGKIISLFLKGYYEKVKF
jgi:hypothetical protein